MQVGRDEAFVTQKVSREFLLRRLHSLAGVAFFLFLFEHLLTNSQAALFFGEDGRGFIQAVNFIHSLPYLQVIELIIIFLPAFVHAYLGIKRLFTSEINVFASDGRSASLPYPNNRAYTWQRLTSWFLLVAILLHVGYMRFVKNPTIEGSKYVVSVSADPGLQSVAARLGITLEAKSSEQVVVRADSVGAALLMVLRDTYKSIWMSSLYSLFVMVAAFHACNGLWTAAITWGVTLTERSRVLFRTCTTAIMALLIFFGLVCVWGVYWINLRS